MERKIGEIFEYNGEWYQAVDNTNSIMCSGCAFVDDYNECEVDISVVGNCGCKDGNPLIFKKLERVGEPYPNAGKLYQLYKLPMNIEKLPPHTEGINLVRFDMVEIVIKQNKEDMEEKKQCGDNRFRAIARAKEHLFQATNIAEDKKELKVLDSFLLRCWQMGWLKQYEDAEEKKLNLKPFDIQKAREGKPVCTRDGRKARIICFDYNGETGDYPIVALVHYNKGNKCYERVLKYTSDGLFNKYGDCQHDDDLMMLPEKKEGWINIIKTEDGVYCCKGELYSDYNDAFIENINVLDNRGITVKIEWEE